MSLLDIFKKLVNKIVINFNLTALYLGNQV